MFRIVIMGFYICETYHVLDQCVKVLLDLFLASKFVEAVVPVPSPPRSEKLMHGDEDVA